jgi:hypothetical protein
MHSAGAGRPDEKGRERDDPPGLEIRDYKLLKIKHN